MDVISRKEAKELGLKKYFTGKPCKYGHVSDRNTSGGYCNQCMSLYRHSEISKAADRRYNASPKSSLTRKAYRSSEEYKSRMRLYKRDKYRKDPMFRVSVSLRRMLLRVIETSGDKKVASSHKILGYSAEDLHAHISKCMASGMSWDNYGDWHIDHIKSIRSFMDEGVTDPSIINALSNLQPLWAKENQSKGAYG